MTAKGERGRGVYWLTPAGEAHLNGFYVRPPGGGELIPPPAGRVTPEEWTRDLEGEAIERDPRGADGNGYYELPSGTVIHLTADKHPTPETLAALDELVLGVRRNMGGRP